MFSTPLYGTGREKPAVWFAQLRFLQPCLSCGLKEGGPGKGSWSLCRPALPGARRILGPRAGSSTTEPGVSPPTPPALFDSFPVSGEDCFQK